MGKYSLSLSLILILASLCACRKDTDPCRFDEFSKKKVIQENFCVEIMQINDKFTPSSGGTNAADASHKIDLDKDGTADLNIFFTLQPIQYYYRAWIACLHENVFIGAQTDTMYTYTKTTYSSSIPVEKHITHGNVCTKPAGTGSTAVLNTVCRFAQPYDTIHVTDSWTNDFVYIFNDDEGISNAGGMSSGPDTITYFHEVYDASCFNPERDQKQYIPIKLIADGETKLGWISVTYTQQNTVILHATGLHSPR